jgi:DNA repair protein RadC
MTDKVSGHRTDAAAIQANPHPPSVAHRLLRSPRVTPAYERPRERLLRHGGDPLSSEELIALILGTGARGKSAVEVARSLLHETGGLVDLSRANPRELACIHGIGTARAARLVAAFHLGRRAMVQPSPNVVVREAADVFEHLRHRLQGMTQEVFLVLALDARGRVQDEIEVARGTLTGVEVHPREVFRPLVRQSAAAAVVAHNHPSGDSQPSPDDIALTRRLRLTGEILGIPLLDHVVIGRDNFSSVTELIGAECGAEEENS